MPINLSVRVSSRVDLFPSLAATNACTWKFSCSSKALNSSSDLAIASVSLPVIKDILVGGSTPRPLNISANLLLLIRSSRVSTPASSSNNSLRYLTSAKCWRSKLASRIRDGSVNILMVMSISFNSLNSKCGANFINNFRVNSTSLRQ